MAGAIEQGFLRGLFRDAYRKHAAVARGPGFGTLCVRRSASVIWWEAGLPANGGDHTRCIQLTQQQHRLLAARRTTGPQRGRRVPVHRRGRCEGVSC